MTCVQTVYLWIIGHPHSSDKEISDGTGLPINNVVARRNELAFNGYVVKSGEKYNHFTKKHVIAWAPAPVQSSLPLYIVEVSL